MEEQLQLNNIQKIKLEQEAIFKKQQQEQERLKVQQ